MYNNNRTNKNATIEDRYRTARYVLFACTQKACKKKRSRKGHQKRKRLMYRLAVNTARLRSLRLLVSDERAACVPCRASTEAPIGAPGMGPHAGSSRQPPHAACPRRGSTPRGHRPPSRTGFYFTGMPAASSVRMQEAPAAAARRIDVEKNGHACHAQQAKARRCAVSPAVRVVGVRGTAACRARPGRW